VSDSAGVAYLYSTSGNLLQTLTDPNNAANDAFGTSVALSGSDVLVGAPGLNGNSGAAYLYSTSGQLLQTFTDPNNKSDDFGISVALSGSDVLVGADGVDGYRGAAYLYSTSGQLLQTFTDPNNTGLDHFGFSVALSDNDALVGAYGVDGEEGAAYLYSTSGQLLQTFTDPNNTASDNFGYSVALSGNSMMVGAYGANGSAGAAYLYSTSDLLLQTFTDPNKTENDNFGTSVAMSGLNLLVGAPKVSGEGAVYIYDTFGHLLQTYNDPNNTANDYFGISLALSGENAVVGSFGTSDDAGAADEFLLPSSLTTLDGSNPSTVVGTAFGSTLEVQVTDSLGNPVTGASVSFIESDGSGGAGGTFTGTTIVSTNAFGIATAPTLTANDVAGSFTVSALLGSLYTTFNLTNSYGAATNLIPLGGSNQSTTLDDAFGTLLQAEVTDTYGNPVPNALVTFAVPATGPSGTFNATSSVLTDANGIATAPALTANNQLGIYTATATVANVGTTSFNLDNTSGKPTELNQDKEGNQTTVVGDTFLKPLEVEVLDTFGNPIPGAIVTFTESNGTTGAGGAFSGSTSVTTNSFGIAAAPTLTANDTAGSFAVTASIGKLYTTFLLNNSNGAPAEIIAAGAPDLTAVVGTAFGKHLEVQALDSFGNPIPGATVTFTEVNGGTGAGGSFTGTTTVSTNALGIATAPTLTANDMAGGFTVTATLGHLLASFPLSNTSGAPATITPLGENDLNTPKGYTYGELPEVQVIDSYGNPVANTPVTFTLPTSGATGSFSSTATMMTNAEGLATAPAITANYQTGTFTLAATVGGVLSPADFTLTNTLVPATMKVLAGSGQRSMIDTAFAKPLEVQVLTSGKVPVAGVTVYFTVPGSGASGTLAQGSVVTNAKGVATMPTLTANGIIGKWSVAARVDGDPEPAVFTVTNITGPAALISSLKGSNQSAKPGKAFATALEALVVDSQGNLVTGASVTFTIVSDAGSGGKFTGGKTTVVIATGAHGIATAPALIANAVPGDFTVKATYSVKGVPADMSCTFDLSIL
jgi:protocatechuate 3,4-dioxygenase beta subunit